MLSENTIIIRLSCSEADKLEGYLKTQSIIHFNKSLNIEKEYEVGETLDVNVLQLILEYQAHLEMFLAYWVVKYIKENPQVLTEPFELIYNEVREILYFPNIETEDMERAVEKIMAFFKFVLDRMK